MVTGAHSDGEALPALHGFIGEPAPGFPPRTGTYEASPMGDASGSKQVTGPPLGAEDLPPSPGRISEAAPSIPPWTGTSEAPPMWYDSGPIKDIVRSCLGVGIVGYLLLMVAFISRITSGSVSDNWWNEAPLFLLLTLHSFGIFGLLFAYFGKNMKVTRDSAQVG